MLNSIVTLIWPSLDLKYPFWKNLTQKNKIVCLRLNLVPRLVRICWIPWWCSNFLFWMRNDLFWACLAQKIIIDCLRWNLVPWFEYAEFKLKSTFYFRPEILFLWANLIKKFEIVCLRLNFVPRLRTLIMMFISFVLDQKYSFWEYWSQIFPKVVIRFCLSYLIWLRPVFGFCFKKLVKVPENASALQSVSVTKNYWITT